MIHWNYRIIRRKIGGEDALSIHEVHYRDNKPVACTEGAIELITFENDLESLQQLLLRIQQALQRPILEESQFEKYPAKNQKPKDSR